MIKHSRYKSCHHHSTFALTHQYRFRALTMLLGLNQISCSSSIHQDKSFPNVLLLMLVFALSSLATVSHASCSRSDHDALMSFYGNISAAPPLNWNASLDCCSWEGVRCDASNRVTLLWLPSRGLVGPFSPSIANLSHLSQLNLSNNKLSGPLPDGFFSALSNLQFVDLSFNSITGQFPSLDSLPATIRTVNFAGNYLNGTLRPSFLRQATQLSTFNISNNSFSGPIPSMCSISPSIAYVDFSLNDFAGTIPAGFANCSDLISFRAGFNHLSGPLPDDIYQTLSLQEMFLPGNMVSGTIASSIVNLSNLRSLVLFGNQFTGMIPPEIGSLSNLEELLLHINNLNGVVPQSLMNCTKLRVLNLRVNNFSGELSVLDFSRLAQLNTIDLGNNNFTGGLPVSLFSCTSLTAIRFAGNNLQGEIFPEILNLRSLSFLSISNNSLTNITGAISILKKLPSLSTLILTKNFYNEALPNDENLISNSEFQNLQILGLGGCSFTGQIPPWLAKLQKLQVLDLSVNKITGKVPGWLGTLPNLFYMDLSQNHLDGGFTVELTGLKRLATQQGADGIDRGYLQLPVFVQPNNASYQQYNQLSSLPPAIYLGNNSLSGNIPPEIGLLKFVHVLDLSKNNFSGSIPDTISNLTDLENLDLSENHLSGEIPASLKNLHFLSSFNVANNDLEGPIPTGGQFDTFPNSSFLGNPRLCGQILQRPCPDTSEYLYHPSKRKSAKKKIIVGLILGISFGVTFTIIMSALWIFSKRRILPRGDAEKGDLETVSFNSNSVTSLEAGKEASQIMLFPQNLTHIKDLSIPQIVKATDNFNQENIIGCGGFGLVYRAILEDGTKLAVKKLSGDMGLMDREFKAEVEALSTAKHKNLVSLQGYCVHDGSRMLIYSYMENGSLDYWLHEKADGTSRLDWPIRLNIARGASNGLAYMHQICEPHIVHRDIKSSNILLDEKFEAHVADFGLSRLILPYQTHVTTELVGTLGYIPPEYNQQWMATLRGDMYSFGVVMLELLTGKRPLELFKPKVSRELVAWVQQMRNEGKQGEVFDAVLKGNGFEEEMLQVLDIACMCVNQNPFKRPTIQEVVDWLKDIGSNRQMPKEGQ